MVTIAHINTLGNTLGRRALEVCLMLGLILGLSAFPLTALAAVTAQLERDTINLDQTVRLVIESSNNGNAQPDFSVLSQNFKVLSTSTSQNISIGNGTQTSSKSWISELEPKAVGTFTIPPIRVGNQQSNALKITVLPPQPLLPGQTADVFVEMEVAPIAYYVQQQLNVVVRLFLGVDIVNGSLSDPAPANTDVRKQDSDVQYQTTVGSRSYRVVERKYVLLPGQSGTMLIPGVKFQGVAKHVSSSGSQTLNSFFNQGSRISATSDPITLNIKPPNQKFTGRNWLPAKHLKITERSSDYGEVQVGQPLTRQIKIHAIGLSADQLPEIEFPDTPNTKQYPDKSARVTKWNGDDIVGTLNRSIAVIATESGVVALPAINLKWWNTTTEKMETAYLPGKTVSIVANPAAIAQNDPSIATAADGSAYSDQSAQARGQSIWKWASFVLLLGWVFTTLYFWKQIKLYRDGKPVAQTKQVADESSRKLLEKIKQACTRDDPKQARSMLHAWAMACWPDRPTQTLQEIADRLDSTELAAELGQLDKYLYAAFEQHSEDKSATSDEEVLPPPAWSGAALARILTALPSIKPAKATPSRVVLPQLYPQTE